jgi:signal transduction histidine kinase
MIFTYGTSGTSLYLFLINSFNQQLNQELLTLVEAAAPSLGRIKSEGRQSLDREVPWRNLFSKQEYSLEWYDSEGKLLAREGANFPSLSLFKTISPAELKEDLPVFQSQGRIQTVTISVYANNSDEQNPTLEGYIRASESTQEIEVILSKLRLGVVLGGITALVLVGISSIYLTREAMTPVKQGVQRLRTLTNDVSHQLRTPLTRISIATEILLSQRDKIQPDQARKLNIINNAVEQIKRLVEEMLFLVRTDMTSNPTEVEFSPVSLRRILQTLSEQFEPIAQARGINFQTQLLDNVLVRGDSDRLIRLFTNLLDNAFNYTDAGGSVVFSTKLSQETVIISVQDTGMGIADEHLPFVFQSFWRSELAKSKQPEGFGLGLTIAHAIVQQHRGEITVSSQRGRGSCFQVHLPLV